MVCLPVKYELEWSQYRAILEEFCHYPRSHDQTTVVCLPEK